MGIEIRKPLPGIHLSYLYASPSIEEWDQRVPGRAFVLSVWVMRSGNRRRLPRVYGYLRGSEPESMSMRTTACRLEAASARGESVRDGAAADSRTISNRGRSRIKAFVERCFGHLQGRGYLVEQRSGKGDVG